MDAGFQVDGDADSTVGVTRRVDTRTADELIRAAATEQRVITDAAGDDVVDRIAVAGKRCGTGVSQAFDVGTQRLRIIVGAHFIIATAGLLDDRATETVDDVNVVPGTAFEGRRQGIDAEGVVESRADHLLDVDQRIAFGVAADACTTWGVVTNVDVDSGGRCRVINSI